MNSTNDSNNRQRRHFADHEKVAILKRHLIDKVPVSDLCDELDIYPNQFYDWLKKFFENGHLALKQARFPSPAGHPNEPRAVRTASPLLDPSSLVLPDDRLFHAALASPRDRAWFRGGSEHPDSDFVSRFVNNAARSPDGKRSADMGSTTAVDTPPCGPSARSGTADA